MNWYLHPPRWQVFLCAITMPWVIAAPRTLLIHPRGDREPKLPFVAVTADVGRIDSGFGAVYYYHLIGHSYPITHAHSRVHYPPITPALTATVHSSGGGVAYLCGANSVARLLSHYLLATTHRTCLCDGTDESCRSRYQCRSRASMPKGRARWAHTARRNGAGHGLFLRGLISS